MRTPRGIVAIVALALLIAGCGRGGGGGAAVAGKPAATYPADAVVLRVSYIGGFTVASEILTRLPVISVYGDGRVITEGAQPAVFPGPVLPSVEMRRISSAGVERLVRLALEAGVGSATDYGEAQITDNASTRFVVLADSGVKTTEVYALEETDVFGVSRSQQAARTKLRKLIDALTDLPGTLGADAGAPAQPYQPTAVAGVAQPWTKIGSQEQPERAWPGPTLPGKPFDVSPDITCVMITGDAVPAILNATRGANGGTPWLSGGGRWLLDVRPLLPDESDCANLGKLAG